VTVFQLNRSLSHCDGLQKRAIQAMKRSFGAWTRAGLMLVTFLLLAAGFAAAAPAPSGPPTLAGFWYGVGEPGDPEVFYIDAFHPDGRFNAEYRKCEKGKLVYQQTQSGTWKIEDGVLTINSTVINGKPDKFDHSYDIELLNATEFHARWQGPEDFLFVERRIPKFEFPDCYLGV
jgi:hypothetical protein